MISLLRGSLSRACVAALLLSAGCYRTAIHSGLPSASEPAQGYDGRLHSAIVGDVVVIDRPYPLQNVCPNQGQWSTIETKTSVRDWFVNLIGTAIYEARSVTVHCAKPPPQSEPAPPPTAPVDGASRTM